MGEALIGFKSKISKIEFTFKQHMKHQDEDNAIFLTQSDLSHKEQMESVKEKTESLKRIHDSEVKEIFNDEKTLNFIQKMRSFKKSWSIDHEMK